MITVFIRHSVRDYAAWKLVYDEIAPARKAKGVVAASVHRDTGDSNTVVVTHCFASGGAASAFMNSDDLMSAMQRAGVSEPPTIWFTEDVELTAS